jgi:His-Xaa-Ser system protein HxsD
VIGDGDDDGFSIRYDSENSAVIYLDPRIYSREAILKASYWCTEMAFVQISPASSDDKFVVHIALKQSAPTLSNPQPTKIAELIGEYCNSVLDFELRRQVSVETEAVRQLILAKAFSESGVLEDVPPGTISDPVETQKPGRLSQIINHPEN